VDRHLLLGHAGNCHDPNTDFQKQDCATASNYFLQDPGVIEKQVAAGKRFNADGFTMTDEPLKVALKESVLVTKIKEAWKGQPPVCPPNERFLSETKKSFVQSDVETLRFARTPRIYGEFSQRVHEGSWVRRSPRGGAALGGVATPRGVGIRAGGQLVVR